MFTALMRKTFFLESFTWFLIPEHIDWIHSGSYRYEAVF